jgi:hypothetical protein
MITAHGVGRLVRIEGNLNASLYCGILQDDALGTFRDLDLNLQDHYFQQDNDPKLSDFPLLDLPSSPTNLQLTLETVEDPPNFNSSTVTDKGSQLMGKQGCGPQDGPDDLAPTDMNTSASKSQPQKKRGSTKKVTREKENHGPAPSRHTTRSRTKAINPPPSQASSGTEPPPSKRTKVNNCWYYALEPSF